MNSPIIDKLLTKHGYVLYKFNYCRDSLMNEYVVTLSINCDTNNEKTIKYYTHKEYMTFAHDTMVNEMIEYIDSMNEECICINGNFYVVKDMSLDTFMSYCKHKYINLEK